MGAGEIVDEGKAEIGANIGSEAVGGIGDNKLSFGKLIGHRPVGTGGEVGEVACFGNLACAIAFRVVEVESSGELWSEGKV